MTRLQAEAHVDSLYGPHWRAPTTQEHQAHAMRGTVWDPDHQDPAWPHQDRERLVEAFVTKHRDV